MRVIDASSGHVTAWGRVDQPAGDPIRLKRPEETASGLAIDACQLYHGGAMTVYETTSHQTIYHWATSRGLWPACVRGEPERIRLGGDDSANPGEELEPIEWWRWFQEFDRRQLQLIYDPSKGWFTLGSRLAPSGG